MIGSDAAKYGANVEKRFALEPYAEGCVIARGNQDEIEQDLPCVPAKRQMPQEGSE